jgi:nucleoside-diphosphate-sugar epimerase
MHYTRDFGIECRIARFHNIYGPHGTWKGGREKAPAAFCRKVCMPLPAVVEVEAKVAVAVAVAEDTTPPHYLHNLFCTLYVCILRAPGVVLLSHCRCPLSATTITPIQVLTSPTEIEMWGDGKQTRSFTFIDDCVEGILRITKSDYREPLNLGSSEMVSMNEMMEMAMSFEGKVGPMKALF